MNNLMIIQVVLGITCIASMIGGIYVAIKMRKTRDIMIKYNNTSTEVKQLIDEYVNLKSNHKYIDRFISISEQHTEANDLVSDCYDDKSISFTQYIKDLIHNNKVYIGMLNDLIDDITDEAQH